LKRIKWGIEVGVVYPLLLFSRLVPRPALLAWGKLLGWLAWGPLRIRRAVVLENLRAAFAERKSEEEIRRLARRFYFGLGRTFMEFLVLFPARPEQILQTVVVDGLEHLDACRREGKGALLVTGHLGNWELAGATLAAHGYPTSYLIKSQANPYVDSLFNDIRRRLGIRVIRQGASVRQLVHAVRQGGFVGMVADQDAGRGGLFVEFLGPPASVFRGPAYFAYRLGCPILPGAIFRQADGMHRLTVAAPLFPDPTWDEETAVRRLTEQHTRALARFIYQAPEQYFWVHRRWKTQP